MFKASEPIETGVDVIFEWLILSLSIIFIFLGLGGLLVVITTQQRGSDVLLQYSYVFIYFYMLILGGILLAYRKKILFKR